MNKIEKAKTKIVLKDKLLSYLLSRFEIVVTKHHGNTAATNGKVIYFNPDFLNSLSTDEVVFVLLHELLHITLDHLGRKNKRNHKKFNIAADVVVNDILVASGYTYNNLPLISGKMFEIDGTMHSVEEVYEKLPIDVKEVYVDNHGFWSDENREGIKKILNDAYEQGSSSSSYLINRMIEGSLKSKTNWREILLNILKQNEKDYTYQKVDNRFGDILLPTFNESELNLDNVWLLVDVSGSMNDNDVLNAYSEINRLISSFESFKLDVSFFSTFVTKPKEVTNKRELKDTFKSMKSGGGTSFDVIFDYLPNLKKLPVAIIVITDGYARFPDKSKAKNVPVFWAINNDRVEPEFGYKINL